MQAAYLLGFRGAGKTTLGSKLAEALGWKFVDLDQEWESLHGQTILEFLEKNGEAAFRQSEHALLQKFEDSIVKGGASVLVATGGGVVESPASRQLLENSRLAKIYLEVSPEALWQRLSGEPERRKIGNLANLEALRALLARRQPFYEKIATYSVKNQDITQALIELKHLLRGL